MAGTTVANAGDSGWPPIARRSGLSLPELELVRRTPVFAGLTSAALAPLLEGALAKEPHWGRQIRAAAATFAG